MQDRNLKYQLIAKDILHRILSNSKLKDHDSFDSEYALSNQYDTTRQTIRKAVEFLVNADVLYKLSRKGVYIKSLFAAKLCATQFEQHGNILFNSNQKKMKRDRIIVFSKLFFDSVHDDMRKMNAYTHLISEAFYKFTRMYPCDLVFSPVHTTEAEKLLDDVSLKNLRQYGLLFIAPLKEDTTVISQLIEKGVKIILLSCGPWPQGFSYVFSEERSAAEMLVNYLVELGHSRIVYFRQITSMSSKLRVKGIIDAGIKNNLPEDELMIIGNKAKKLSQLRKLLKGERRPTAIITDFQSEYFACLNIVQECGLQVPEDISMCTFDDTSFLNFQEVPVTAIRQPIEEIVFTGIQELLHLKNGSKVAPIVNETLQTKLIVRSSVAYAPGVTQTRVINCA